MPIWVADYVLISYGTGAIMAVPAHDERDFEFAKQFDLPIIAVVDPGDAVPPVERDEVLAGKRVLRRRGRRDQLRQVQRPADRRVQEARSPPTSPQQGLGREAVNYKLRDWLFRRQRFWGEPFPILHELDADGQADGPRPRRRRRRTCRSTCRTWTTSSRTAGPSRRWTKRPTSGSTQ